MFKGLWHECRLLNYPWVDTRPTKYLNAHTSLIGEYLLKWTVCQGKGAFPALSKANCMASCVLIKVTAMHPQHGPRCMMVTAQRQQC